MAVPSGSGGDGTGRRTDGSTPTLSVVVIAKDEGDRIDACLSSILAACEPIDDVEVVLVDSRSTDSTVAAAREYPITILRLPASAPVTPSAGRYVGAMATSGDLVLFVDGDMVLTDGWLPAACERVRSTPDLAGVDGHLDDADRPADGTNAATDRETDVLRGVALYDREAYEAVGGFDPHLESLEDIDLSYRLDAAGYRLVRLSTIVANHPRRDGDSERARRWAQGYYHGRGQLFAKYLSRPRLFARLCYRTRIHATIVCWLCLAPIAALVGGVVGVAAWGGATVLGLVGTTTVQSLEWTTDKLAGAAPVLAGVVLGFPGRHPAAHEYPIERVDELACAPEPDEALGARTA